MSGVSCLALTSSFVPRGIIPQGKSMVLKPSVMSKPERKITEGGENQIQSSPEFCSKLGGPDALAPILHRTSENIRGSIRPCGSRPDICKFFTYLAFVRRPGVATTPCVSPLTRRRQDAPSSSGRRVPTTPPGIVGRGVLTMPPRVVRTSRRRHDAPHAHDADSGFERWVTRTDYLSLKSRMLSPYSSTCYRTG